jgi:hypothetical protein
MADDLAEIFQPDQQTVARLNAAQKARETDIGKIGTWFGTRDNAVIYLAWSIIAGAVIGGVILAGLDPTLRADTAKALMALALAALGFMFGRTSASSS